MNGCGGNCYQTGRICAGLSQEAAAEALSLAVRTLQAYEAGERTPPAEVVCAMVDLYGDVSLGLRHVRGRYPFLRQLLPETEDAPLPEAVLRLVSMIYAFADEHQDRRLMRIAADGVIDELERPEFDAIMAELREIVRAALAVGGKKAAGPRAVRSAEADGQMKTVSNVSIADYMRVGKG